MKQYRDLNREILLRALEPLSPDTRVPALLAYSVPLRYQEFLPLAVFNEAIPSRPVPLLGLVEVDGAERPAPPPLVPVPVVSLTAGQEPPSQR